MRRFMPLLAMLMTSPAFASGAPAPAAETDPVALGWMQGTPPAPERQIRFGTHYDFPKTRWSFSNWRRLFPTVGMVPAAQPMPLPRAIRSDLDAVTFVPIGGREPMSWRQSLAANYTDAIVVLHRGRLVYEASFGVTRPETAHILWSVTKSYVGLLAELLIAEGRLDPAALATAYVPELAASGFAGATVRDVLDMTTGIAFSEQYGDPDSGISRHVLAGGMLPRPPGYQGPDGFLAFLRTIGPEGRHGDRFAYRTANTDALGWVVARAAGEALDVLLQKRIWIPLGMANGADWHVDPVGTPFAGGGLSASVLDVARLGEILRNRGRAGGRQLLRAAAIDSIFGGGDPARFDAASYPSLAGWSYRSQWWVAPDGVVMARGVHGQALWIDRRAEVVIARVASHPVAGNVANDPVSLAAYRAIADHLSGRLSVGTIR
jgi:CubicO group peptidase (beta-lactamase class C family)